MTTCSTCKHWAPERDAGADLTGRGNCLFQFPPWVYLALRNTRDGPITKGTDHCHLHDSRS